jgi:hypothetical protein
MDKKPLNASSYDTDKAQHAHYLEHYEEYFRPFVGKPIKLLELGVYKGGSLLLWRDYFEAGLIVGLDLNAVNVKDDTGRIRIYQGEQQDTALLDRIAQENAPDGFDIIIDDCSHIGELTRISFWHLFDNHLRPGGLYVIEDWSTGYWDDFFDGAGFTSQPKVKFSPAMFRLRSRIARAQRMTLAHRLPMISRGLVGLKRLLNRRQFRDHPYGLVGFIKELVDECGMADVTHPERGRGNFRQSKFKEMKIVPGQVFIVKARCDVN